MITCVGPIFLDRVIKIEEFPEKPIKLVANGLEKRLGGPAPVASFAIKSLGGEAQFIGRFGDDDAADYLKSELLNSGISTVRRKQQFMLRCVRLPLSRMFSLLPLALLYGIHSCIYWIRH